MEITLFGEHFKFSDKRFSQLRKELRTVNHVKSATAGKNEKELFELLAFEKATLNRTFALERIYSKFAGARSRRERIELLTAS